MKSLSKNYLYNLSYQILTLLTPLITTPYISRVLGIDGIGEYSFSYSIVAYFVLLAQFGITNFAQREIAYHQDDREAQSRIFFEIISFQILTVVISLICYYILGRMWHVDSQIYWVQALNIVAVLFDVSWFFQGLEEFDKIVVRNFIVRLANIALLFLLIKSPDDLILYTFIMGGMNVVSGILICLFLKDYVHKVSINEIHPFRNWKPILQLFLPQVAIQIYVVLDKTMLGFFADSYVENGYYEQADKIIKLLLTIATSLGTVMLPRMAATVARGEMEAARKFMIASYRFSFFLTIPMCFGLITVSSNFVPWFFGPGYEPVAGVLNIISSMLIAIGLSNVTGIQFMIPMNRQNQLTLSVIAGAIFNFIINLYLIPNFYSTGVAIATVLTEWLVTFVQFYLVRDFFSGFDIFSQGKNYFFSGFIMLLITGVLSHCLTSSIMHSLILVLIGSVIYGGILFIAKDQMVMIFINKIKERFR